MNTFSAHLKLFDAQVTLGLILRSINAASDTVRKELTGADKLAYEVAEKAIIKMYYLSRYASVGTFDFTSGEGQSCFNDQEMFNGYKYNHFKSDLPGFPEDFLFCCGRIGYQFPCNKKQS